MRLLTASLNALPAENLAVFAAGILISAPVAGLRPSLAALLPDLKVPKPISCTTPPLVTALIILSMTELKPDQQMLWKARHRRQFFRLILLYSIEAPLFNLWRAETVIIVSLARGY